MDSTVFVVDDDPGARESVGMLVRSMQIPSELFHSAEAFLESFDEHRPGCVVTDVRMLGMSGLELLTALQDRNSNLPVIVLTAFATTPLTVRAMQSGAVTLLDKPYRADELWEAIRQSLAENERGLEEASQKSDLVARIQQLSQKEIDVLRLVLKGCPNKTIASQLGVCMRTVENRRRQIYTKLQAESVVELVQVVYAAGLESLIARGEKLPA